MINDWTQSIINQAKAMNVENAQEFVRNILGNTEHSLYEGITIHPEPKDFYGVFVRTYRHWEKTGEMEVVDRDEEAQFYEDIRSNRIEAVRKAAEILNHFITIKGIRSGSYDRIIDEYNGDMESIIEALESHKESFNKIETDKRDKKIQREKDRKKAAKILEERKKHILDVAEEFQQQALSVPINKAMETALEATIPSGLAVFTDADRQSIETKMVAIDTKYQKDLTEAKQKQIDRYFRLLKTKKAVVSRASRPITHVSLDLPNIVPYETDVNAFTEMYIYVVRCVVENTEDITPLLEMKGDEYPLASQDASKLSQTCFKNGSYKHIELNDEIYAVDTHGSTLALEQKAKKVLTAYGFETSRLIIT